jgi:hypothetical protein
LKRPVPIFLGYDPREAVAYHTCVQSIIEHCSEPARLSFHPVTGERRDGSNDFIYERFLVPHRCGFVGSAVFMDGDMIVRGDVVKLADQGVPMGQGVRVVKHDYKTKHPTKYLGNPNQDYPRKNWSSVVVWDCGFYPNRKLTPEFVRGSSGEYLHRFSWLTDNQIGSLPDGWNRLVLEQPVKESDALLHYTIGIPAFAEYADCDHAQEWWATYQRAIKPCH